MIEDFAKLIPDSLKCRSGAVFFSGRTAFSNSSELYVLGINPGGGDPDNTPESSISSHIEYVLGERCADWSGYRDDRWGRHNPGEHFLQRNVLHLLSRVGKKGKEHTVPASEVVFLKSRGVSGLKQHYGKSYAELADEFWDFHEAVIKKLCVKVVVCYGKPSGEYVRKRLNAHKQVDELSCRSGKRMVTGRTYRNAEGLTVVKLWFPSSKWWPSWLKAKPDPTDLVIRALRSRVRV